MAAYILRRMLLMIPTLFLVSVLMFSLLRVSPEDPVQLLAETGNLQPDDIAALRKQLGLDEPAVTQYFKWSKSFVQGDFGKSYTRTGQKADVGDLITRAFPISLQLGIMAILIGLCISIPLGVISAVRFNSWIDQAARLFMVIGLSVPSFWLATMVIVYPSIWWNYSPPLTYTSPGEDLLKNLQQFIVPAFLAGLVLSASTSRLMRSMMLDVWRQDYIRTAKAKGLAESRVIFRHALRNALIPVITSIGLQAGIIIGGSAIIETIFNLPGIGQLLVTATGARDYPVIQTVAMMISAFVIFLNMIVDVSYGIIDPRIRRR